MLQRIHDSVFTLCVRLTLLFICGDVNFVSGIGWDFRCGIFFVKSRSS